MFKFVTSNVLIALLYSPLIVMPDSANMSYPHFSSEVALTIITFRLPIGLPSNSSASTILKLPLDKKIVLMPRLYSIPAKASVMKTSCLMVTLHKPTCLRYGPMPTLLRDIWKLNIATKAWSSTGVHSRLLRVSVLWRRLPVLKLSDLALKMASLYCPSAISIVSTSLTLVPLVELISGKIPKIFSL